MKLINVEATFDKENLGNVVSLFSEQAIVVRKMQGSRHYEIYWNVEGNRIAIVQHWDTVEDFDTYRKSAVFTELGKLLRPLMTSAPVTTIAQIDTE